MVTLFHTHTRCSRIVFICCARTHSATAQNHSSQLSHLISLRQSRCLMNIRLDFALMIWEINVGWKVWSTTLLARVVLDKYLLHTKWWMCKLGRNAAVCKQSLERLNRNIDKGKENVYWEVTLEIPCVPSIASYSLLSNSNIPYTSTKKPQNNKMLQECGIHIDGTFFQLNRQTS